MSRRNKKKKPLGKVARNPESALASPVSETPGPADDHSLKNQRGTSSDYWKVFGVCVFLAAITFIVFGQTLGCDFINFDDDTYVYENPVVQKGLTFHGIIWAFSAHASNWHPLTWMSHMLDCELYGLNPTGHHLTSVLLHAATATLLFLVLRAMAGALWRSAFVAALFAIHPLRVESVAWVAERKDVLSGLFFMLTIAAYIRYARNSRRLSYYLMVVLLFALGLMSKPMLVTLPFVLLLLDYWPLNRWRPKDSKRLVIEKLPLFGLAAALCVITLLAQKEAASSFPLPTRVGNALVSYAVYLEQMIWPAGLAIFYPYPHDLEFWKIIASVFLLLAVLAIAIAARRKCPYFLSGWLWYLGMLVPVIGILQVGLQARADRYTYLPQIGLYIALTWAAADFLFAGWRHRNMVLGSCSALILAVLAFCAHRQVAYWRNSEALWTHALACTPDNFIARNNLGDALLQKNEVNEAIVQYQRALQLNPNGVLTYNNLGDALFLKGNADAAIACYQKALQLKPDDMDALCNLGKSLFKEGNLDEAITCYQKALQINPDNTEIDYDLGNVLLQKGDFDAAIKHYKKALPMELNNAEAYNNLGFALFQNGKVDEAIAQYQSALQIKPDYAEAHNNLGNALARKGDVDEAATEFQEALQIEPTNAGANNNLGVISLQHGRLADAIAYYQTAVKLNPDSPEFENNLAWMLAAAPQASLRNGVQALKLAQQANQQTGGNNPIILHTLAAAYAETGRFNDAQRIAEQAIGLAQAAGQQGLAQQLAVELKFYQAGLPYHMGDK